MPLSLETTDLSTLSPTGLLRFINDVITQYKRIPERNLRKIYSKMSDTELSTMTSQAINDDGIYAINLIDSISSAIDVMPQILYDKHPEIALPIKSTNTAKIFIKNLYEQLNMQYLFQDKSDNISLKFEAIYPRITDIFEKIPPAVFNELAPSTLRLLASAKNIDEPLSDQYFN